MNVRDLRQDEHILAEGKTKVLITDGDGTVLICSKDDITAGDGAKHDQMPGKAAISTETTSNVFMLLGSCGIPVAFLERIDETTFCAPRCDMYPYEVVVRREARGSCLKRHPGLKAGHFFPRLIVEFYLKTQGKRWNEHTLPCDDPLMRYVHDEGTIQLFDPTKPAGRAPFVVLDQGEVFRDAHEFKQLALMEDMARHAFLILEKAWQNEGCTLADLKVEFGVDTDGDLLLADVIDNDSWRVLEGGKHLDKQVYRDGGMLTEVRERYLRVAEHTGHFWRPNQQIVIWKGSKADDSSPILTALLDMYACDWRDAGDVDECDIVEVTCSMHKEPLRGIDTLHQLVRDVPDTVIIALVGRSNGAGPTLSAMTTVPVITVPANYRKFPHDVWSSLRAASEVPVVTALEPANAALAACEVLALRDPMLYALIRYRLEKRLVNMIAL